MRLGLVAHRPRAGGYYDRNRDRLVCPVIVPGGEVVGFSSRDRRRRRSRADDGSEPPKYINSPESAVYKKSKLLFGLAQAREAMQAQKRAVLVEGNFDVITLHQAGFAEVVAPLGTALTIEQVNVLKRLTERIVLLYDGDRAGYKATMHALQMCVEADVEVLVARAPGQRASPAAPGCSPTASIPTAWSRAAAPSCCARRSIARRAASSSSRSRCGARRATTPTPGPGRSRTPRGWSRKLRTRPNVI